jgi:hypothetical protein
MLSTELNPSDKWRNIMEMLINISAFMVLAILWLGFGAAIFIKRDVLDGGWQAFRRLPMLMQLTIGLLALPLVVGLWVWQTRWPFWLRLALVAGLAWITLYTFFPQLPTA